MLGILQENAKKIKDIALNQSSYLTLVIVLVAVASFGLGRRSVSEEVKPVGTAPADVESVEVGSVVDDNVSTSGTYYVASKNGEAYHLPFCSGAKRISEANLVTFESKAEAEASGYRPAANCPGI